MTNTFPLLIIMGTIVAMVAIQRALSKFAAVPENIAGKTASPPPPPSKPRGIMLFPGLTVIGLDGRGTDHLKSLIKKGDSAALAAFLASHRPGILELDEYLERVRSAFNRAQSDVTNKTNIKNIRNLLKIFKPLKPPANIHFELLNPTEYEECLTFNPKSKRLVTRDLMAQFGGHKFSQYFGYYCAHPKSVTMSIPPLDPGRSMIEALEETGVASKGRHIPLESRLTVLKMNQLRQMCKDLNHDTKYTRRKDATKALAQMPGAAVLLSMSYVVDDLFILNPIENETYDINREWNYISAYAKLLISRTNSKTAPVTS
ncbi:MAG: hypothetical protein V3R49_07655 [Gammaproteobacteria bacterium]